METIPEEVALRVPFLIRYPGKIPAKKVSNDIVHLVNVSPPTLANFAGGDVPQDRIMDGVDQSDFLMGNMAYPSIYNLVIDPKEEVPEDFYLDDTWVDAPLWQVIEDHQASIAEDPGAPDP